MPFPYDHCEANVDPILGKSGTAQFLDAAHHDDEALSITEHSNIPTKLPEVSGPNPGNASNATAASPLGRGFSSSLEGDNSGGESGDGGGGDGT
jgi:hypothetical protein